MELALSISPLELEDRNRIVEACKKPLTKEALNEICLRLALMKMVQRGGLDDDLSQLIRQSALS